MTAVKNKINDTSTHEQVASRAYELFMQHGATDGSDLSDWLMAERELTQRPKAAATRRKTTQTLSKKTASTTAVSRQRKADSAPTK